MNAEIRMKMQYQTPELRLAIRHFADFLDGSGDDWFNSDPYSESPFGDSI